MQKSTNTENQGHTKAKNSVFDEWNCPRTVAMKVLGGKWKLILINLMVSDAPIRFGALKRGMPGITQTMLTAQLRELERDGIISRRIYAEIPPRVEYRLTELGRTLAPIAGSLHEWGMMFIQQR